MTSVFKNTRLEWLTKDLAEDYAFEHGVNQAATTEKSDAAHQKKVDAEITTTEKNVALILGINVLCYPLNFLVTYVIGVHGYLLEKSTFEELSSIWYPTLLTPDHWGFLVWHVIFAAQFIWILLPMLCMGKRDSAYLHMVERSYLTLTLAQAGYTLSFIYEIIWLSMIFIVVVLGSLLMIFQRIYSVEERTPGFGTYMQWFFPFTIHLGWAIPATVYQLSVTLAYYEQEDLLGLIILGISTFAVLFMAILFVNLNEFVVPSVIAFTFVSIYTELEDPLWAIEEKYSAELIDGLQWTFLGAAGVIVFWTMLGIFSLIVDWMLEGQEDEEKRQTEDNKAFDSASAYVPAQV